MNEKIIKRIVNKTGVSNLVEVLAKKLSMTDLQSLLLEIYRRRTNNLKTKDLLENYKKNRFVKPSTIDPEKLLRFNQLAYSILPKDFKIIELSPVSPLGSCSIVSPVDQNNVVSSLRNTEVVSDSTNVLALECVIRRKEIYRKKQDAGKQIKLCSSHRQLRAQQFDEPAAFPHFQLFCLVTAGRDNGSFKFEQKSLTEHLFYYLRLLNELKNINIKIHCCSVEIFPFDNDLVPFLDAELSKNLKIQFPETNFNINQSTQDNTYYSNLRFQIFCSNKQGEKYLIVDGGFTDWTQKLLSNKKERFLTSGIGSERLIFCFAYIN
ncbi:hypothetical protein ACFLS9_04490 [Bacteroidota bacterium]